MRSFFASLSAFLKGVTCEHHDPISAHHDLVRQPRGHRPFRVLTALPSTALASSLCAPSLQASGLRSEAHHLGHPSKCSEHASQCKQGSSASERQACIRTPTLAMLQEHHAVHDECLAISGACMQKCLTLRSLKCST